jgi:DNA-binding response OmpR family regulator
MRQRVLVVEDDDDARDALALILASQGYELETAGDGDAAIAKAQAFHPDVLICDWLLPGMDGVSVARIIQRTDPVPVIFVTSHSVADLRRSATDLRVHAYLPKPIDVGRLRSALLGLA